MSPLRSLCPAHGCLQRIKQPRIFCDEHWGEIPSDLQRWVFRLWGIVELEDELERAVKECVRALKKAKE